MNKLKVCAQCGQNKPLTDYTYYKNKNRYDTYCKNCRAEYMRDYREMRKHKRSEADEHVSFNKSNLRRMYGLNCPRCGKEIIYEDTFTKFIECPKCKVEINIRYLDRKEKKNNGKTL